MKLNYKSLSQLLGISKTTFYEWDKELKERKIIKLLRMYFNDNDLIQFNKEEKIDSMELYQEWKRNQTNIEIELIKKLYNIILDENNNLYDYLFIDFIMKLFLEFEKLKKGTLTTYDNIGLISYKTNFMDLYNLYMLSNDNSIFKNANNTNFKQHTILKKLKALSTIDDQESLVLQKNVNVSFEDMLNTSTMHGNIDESKGIALLALIYFVYSNMLNNTSDKLKQSPEYKINFAIQNIKDSIMSTQSNKKISKLYIDAKTNLENSLNLNKQ